MYVKNLNFITTENSLREVFEKIGLVRSVKIIKTKDGKSMGYGFAEFEKG